MDPHFDPAKSSSSSVKTCGAAQSKAKCFFRQSYSEGSSWHAFKVSDHVYLGGEKAGDMPEASNLTAHFEFGCQDYENGLFRTQVVDGIMGLSASDETLPFQLYRQQKMANKLFALCFRGGGGVMTLGGVDTSLHRYSVPSQRVSSSFHLLSRKIAGSSMVDSQLEYVKLVKPSGWFTVHLLDILLLPPGNQAAKSIGGPIFKSLGGKGTIVDSGTTDTYLPYNLAPAFKALFSSLTGGIAYENKLIKLTDRKYASLPTIVYRLEGATGGQVDIHQPPRSYLERHGDGDSYTPRVYLTEGTGAVLGANFIINYNVVFDIEQMRLGFARSDCAST
jgi:hypothetical protein